MLKKAKIAVPLLIAVLAFSGCSDATSTSTADSASGYSAVGASSFARTTSNSSDSGTSDYSYTDDVSDKSVDDYSESSNGTSDINSKASDKSVEVNDNESKSSRKLIRTKSVTVETKNLDKSLEKVNTAIDTFGAYVEYSTLDSPSYVSEYNDRRTYTMTIRVPEDKLDAFMNQLDSTGTVTNATESTEDVTLQYTDIEAHKKALKTEYDRVMELLEKAETMDQILALESKLSDLRYQLDSYESQLKVMDNQITYSTVSLTLREVEYEKDADKSYGTRIVNAFKDGIHDVKSGLADFSVWFVLVLPSLVVLGIVIAILVAIGKAIWKKTAVVRAKRRAERAKVLANRRVPRGISPEARNKVFGAGTSDADSSKSRVDDDK